MIPRPDWDAPADEHLEARLVAPAEVAARWTPEEMLLTGLDAVSIALGAGGALSGPVRDSTIWVIGTSTGERVAEIPAGANAPAASFMFGLVEQRLGSMTLREFVEEYAIDARLLDVATVRAYLGIGSNLGDRLAYLQGAVDGLAATDGIEVVAASAVIETDPVGPEQPDYLNAVVAVDTTLSPHELLAVCQRLEAEAERVREERWGPRTLDVDVVLYGDETVDTPDLQIPHPRLQERDFVLAPLADLGHPAVAPRDWTGVRPTGLTLQVP